MPKAARKYRNGIRARSHRSQHRPCAVSAWQQDLARISFRARFGGVSQLVSIPIGAVLAIYAKENGKGMVFEKEERGDPPPVSPPPAPPSPDTGKKRRSHLQVIK